MVRNFIQQNCEMTLEELIKDNSWNIELDLCINLLNNTLREEDKDYLKSNLGNLSHLMDLRNPNTYALELILGWVIEDAILWIFTKDLNLNCTLGSADRKREFLDNPKASSDLRIIINSHELFLEIISDYTGYWNKTNKIDLRDNKYNNLKNEDGIIFGIDLLNRKFLIFKVNLIDETKVRYTKEYRPFGNKAAYSIPINKSFFYYKKDLRKYFKDFL